MSKSPPLTKSIHLSLTAFDLRQLHWTAYKRQCSKEGSLYRTILGKGIAEWDRMVSSVGSSIRTNVMKRKSNLIPLLLEPFAANRQQLEVVRRTRNLSLLSRLRPPILVSSLWSHPVLMVQYLKMTSSTRQRSRLNNMRPYSGTRGIEVGYARRINGEGRMESNP